MPAVGRRAPPQVDGDIEDRPPHYPHQLVLGVGRCLKVQPPHRALQRRQRVVVLHIQNIFVRDFQPDELTAGLDTVVLYTAGSITTSGPGLAVADDRTESSLAENNGDLYVMARAADRNVLAISDLP